MSEKRVEWAERLGAILQGVVLAGLLLLAISELALVQSGATVFEYQGY